MRSVSGATCRAVMHRCLFNDMHKLFLFLVSSGRHHNRIVLVPFSIQCTLLALAHDAVFLLCCMLLTECTLLSCVARRNNHHSLHSSASLIIHHCLRHASLVMMYHSQCVMRARIGCNAVCTAVLSATAVVFLNIEIHSALASTIRNCIRNG